MGDSEIREWANQGENLDVYQIAAIFEGTDDKRLVCMSYWKTISCAGLQTFGIIILMLLQWEAAGYDCPNVDLCSGNFKRDSWIAFFFAMFVSLACGEQLRTLGDYGMYQWGSAQPASVSRFWVAIGFCTNAIVLSLTWVCSTLTIMTSKGIDVIVLNSVAVLFMVSLDDEIVSFADYSMVQQSLGSGGISKCCKACDIIGGCLLKLQLLWKIPYLCQLIMFPITVVVPIAVLVCYNSEEFIDVNDCTVKNLDAAIAAANAGTP